VPAAVGVNDAENVAVDTPPLVVIGALPEIPGTAILHVDSEYNVKATLPVGAAAPVAENVAVSDAKMFTPAVSAVGDATVEIDGDAGPTTICSIESPHVVRNGLLLPSPEYDASQ
jgi:hypothetical protein